MQVDFDSIQPETFEHFKGGEGSVTTQAYVDGNNRIMKATVHPHSSIGWHQHVGNTEPYYILKGVGTFVDNDGTKTEVHPGDVCSIKVGQWHAMENNTDEDMEMIAFVMNE